MMLEALIPLLCILTVLVDATSTTNRCGLWKIIQGSRFRVDGSAACTNDMIPDGKLLSATIEHVNTSSTKGELSYTNDKFEKSKFRFANAVGNFIVFAGGEINGTDYTNDVDIYDVSKGEWKNLKMRDLFSHHASCSIEAPYGPVLVLMGGLTAPRTTTISADITTTLSFLNIPEVPDVDQGSNEIKVMRSGVVNLNAALVEGRYMVFSNSQYLDFGKSDHSKDPRYIYIYDSRSSKVYTVNTYIERKEGACIVAIGSFAFISGGRNDLSVTVWDSQYPDEVTTLNPPIYDGKRVLNLFGNDRELFMYYETSYNTNRIAAYRHCRLEISYNVIFTVKKGTLYRTKVNSTSEMYTERESTKFDENRTWNLIAVHSTNYTAYLLSKDGYFSSVYFEDENIIDITFLADLSDSGSMTVDEEFFIAYVVDRKSNIWKCDLHDCNFSIFKKSKKGSALTDIQSLDGNPIFIDRRRVTYVDASENTDSVHQIIKIVSSMCVDSTTKSIFYKMTSEFFILNKYVKTQEDVATHKPLSLQRILPFSTNDKVSMQYNKVGRFVFMLIAEEYSGFQHLLMYEIPSLKMVSILYTIDVTSYGVLSIPEFFQTYEIVHLISDNVTSEMPSATTSSTTIVTSTAYSTNITTASLTQPTASVTSLSLLGASFSSFAPEIRTDRSSLIVIGSESSKKHFPVVIIASSGAAILGFILIVVVTWRKRTHKRAGGRRSDAADLFPCDKNSQFDLIDVSRKTRHSDTLHFSFEGKMLTNDIANVQESRYKTAECDKTNETEVSEGPNTTYVSLSNVDTDDTCSEHYAVLRNGCQSKFIEGDYTDISIYSNGNNSLPCVYNEDKVVYTDVHGL